MKVYFDETNHNRKIGFSQKGSLRFKEESEFFYLFSFIEISQEQLKKIEVLEEEYKKSRKIINELKSKDLLKNKHHKIYHMKDDQIKFYTDLFKILYAPNKLMILGYIEKIDPFMRKMFSVPFTRKIIGDKWNLFNYSLAKYLSIRRLKDINEILSRNISCKIIYKSIIKWLHYDISKSDVSEEKNAFAFLIVVLTKLSEVDTRKWNIKFLKWWYGSTAMSLENSLNEKNINNLTVIYDKMPELELLWKDVESTKSNELHLTSIAARSKNELGIRVVDWVIGFLRKFIIDLSHESIINRQKFNTSIFLSSETLDFIEKYPELFRTFWEILPNDYWTTFANIYADDFKISLITIKNFYFNKIISKDAIHWAFQNRIDKDTQ